MTSYRHDVSRAIDALGRKITKQPEDRRPGKVVVICTDGGDRRG